MNKLFKWCLTLVCSIGIVFSTYAVLSPKTPIVTVSTTPKPPPSSLNPPGNLQAVYTNNVIVLTWLDTNTTNTGEKGFYLYRNDPPSTNITLHFTVMLPALTYTDATVVISNNYSYQAVAASSPDI